MVDPRILLLLIILAGGYYVGEKVVEGIKVVDEKIVEVAKATGHKLLHVVTFGKKGKAESPCQAIPNTSPPVQSCPADKP